LSLASYDDWRLPTISELRSLIRGCDGTVTGGLCGVTDDCTQSTCIGPSCQSCDSGAGPNNGCYSPAELTGECDWYWSSSQVVDGGVDAWAVAFSDGRVDYANGHYDNFGYARCVRGTWNGAPEWTDASTGLTWQNGATVGTTLYEWLDAVDYCSSLNWEGHGGWRLPTVSELRTLIRGCDTTESDGSCGVTDSCLDSSCQDDSCTFCDSGAGSNNGCYSPAELTGECNWYWSSSPVADIDYRMWYVRFINADVNYANYRDAASVRCVR